MDSCTNAVHFDFDIREAEGEPVDAYRSRILALNARGWLVR
jgi:hypothetical protein